MSPPVAGGRLFRFLLASASTDFQIGPPEALNLLFSAESEPLAKYFLPLWSVLPPRGETVEACPLALSNSLSCLHLINAPLESLNP